MTDERPTNKAQYLFDLISEGNIDVDTVRQAVEKKIIFEVNDDVPFYIFFFLLNFISFVISFT